MMNNHGAAELWESQGTYVTVAKSHESVGAIRRFSVNISPSTELLNIKHKMMRKSVCVSLTTCWNSWNSTASLSAWEIWISQVRLCLKPSLSDIPTPPPGPHSYSSCKLKTPTSAKPLRRQGFHPFLKFACAEIQWKGCISPAPTALPVFPPLISADSDRSSDVSAPDLVPPLKSPSPLATQLVKWRWR